MMSYIGAGNSKTHINSIMQIHQIWRNMSFSASFHSNCTILLLNNEGLNKIIIGNTNFKKSFRMR